MQAFVRAYSGADGLPERYFKINPQLRYYTAAFGLRDEDEGAFRLAAENGLLSYVPEETEFRHRENYFKRKEAKSDAFNFRYDRDDFFMQELAFTLRSIFIEALID